MDDHPSSGRILEATANGFARCQSPAPSLNDATKRSDKSPLTDETPRKKRSPCKTDLFVSIAKDLAGQKAFRKTPLPKMTLQTSILIDSASSVGSCSPSSGPSSPTPVISDAFLQSDIFDDFDVTWSQRLGSSSPVSAEPIHLPLDQAQAIASQRSESPSPIIIDVEDDAVQPCAESHSSVTREELEEPFNVYGGKKGDMFKANRTIHVDDVPYYPETPSSESGPGVLYVINVARMHADLKKAMHTHIAYSHTEKGSSNETNVKYAGAGYMKARRFGCNGVKICSGLHADVVHEHRGGPSTEDLLKQNAVLSKDIVALDVPRLPDDFKYGPLQPRLTLQNMTFAYAQFVERRILLKGYCQQQDSVTKVKCSGIPQVRQVTDKRALPECDALGSPTPRVTWLLGCSKWKPGGDGRHFVVWNLEDKLVVDLFKPLLAQIMKRVSERKMSEIEFEPKYKCSSILHHASQKVRCDELHGSARCHYISSKSRFGACPVSFTLLTPIPRSRDQEKAYLFVSGGYHNHAPSPPSRTPQNIMKHIKETIRRMEPGTLFNSGPSQLVDGPDFARLLERYGVRSLETIHPSLTLDQIAGLIAKQRKLAAPDGRGFKDAQARYIRELTWPSEERYVRQAAELVGCNIVICFTNAGARSLYASEYLEADLAFKRVKGEMKEMEIITFSQAESRTITHARIFMNSETVVAYFAAFRLLFEAIADALKRPILTFNHLDPESNLYAIIADFDTKQSKGLGLYLESTDREGRPWQWQILQCARYCQIHFARGIDTTFPRHPAAGLMKGLPRCATLDEYERVLRHIKGQWPDTTDWVRHKLQGNVACGLISDASGIPLPVWLRIPKDTNASESAHHASNALGKNLQLADAIQKGQTLAERSDLKSKRFEETGAKCSQRSKSLLTQMRSSLYQRSRKEQLRDARDSGCNPARDSVRISDQDTLPTKEGPDEETIMIEDLDPLQHINSSGTAPKKSPYTVPKRRGRPVGSKNKTTLAKIAVKQAESLALAPSGGSVPSPNSIDVGEGEPCERPQGIAIGAASPSVTVSDQIYLSEEDSAILGRMPTKVQDLFMEQCDVLISELEKDNRMEPDSEVLRSRARFPVETFSRVSEQVKVGGRFLDFFTRVWQVNLEQRRRLL